VRAPSEWDKSFAMENVISLWPSVAAWNQDSQNMLGGSQTRVKAGQRQVHNIASQDSTLTSNNCVCVYRYRSTWRETQEWMASLFWRAKTFGIKELPLVKSCRNRMLSRILGELIQNRLERLTVLLTAEMIENQSALSAVAYADRRAFKSIIPAIR